MQALGIYRAVFQSQHIGASHGDTGLHAPSPEREQEDSGQHLLWQRCGQLAATSRGQ